MDQDVILQILVHDRSGALNGLIRVRSLFFFIVQIQTLIKVVRQEKLVDFLGLAIGIPKQDGPLSCHNEAVVICIAPGS